MMMMMLIMDVLFIIFIGICLDFINFIIGEIAVDMVMILLEIIFCYYFIK